MGRGRPTSSADALLADDRLAFCRHYLASARRYRPHLLTEPEERILADKSLTASSAWVRLFSELTSAITVDLDGGDRGPRAGSVAAAVARPRGAAQPRPRRSPSALAPGLRTRAFVFNTLLADKATDDRLRQLPDGWIASRNLANEASDESVQALVDAVQARYDIPQRWYALKAQLLGLDQLADYDRMASVATSDEEFGWNEARELVLDAYASFSPELADVGRALLRRVVDRRADAAGQAAGCVLRVHRAVPAPVPAAQLDVAPPRRAHARARDGSRPARVPRARAGRLPPDHAADAGRDRVGVRRDGHVRSAARRDRPIPRRGSRCWPRASRARSPRCSARSR